MQMTHFCVNRKTTAWYNTHGVKSEEVLNVLKETAKRLFKTDVPFAIAMWDFSWLERRWPGGGYDNWDKALNELVERGYNAVRIDAYPHLVSKDLKREWTLNPVWTTQDWGASEETTVCLKDTLRTFLRCAREHNIMVGLSTWFRQDKGHVEMEIRTPETHAEIWIKTLDYIKEMGELDNILYVDFCNEWPLLDWAPFLGERFTFCDEKSISWMKRATDELKKHYPDIPVTFSCVGNSRTLLDMDVSCLDFLEPHIWMPTVSGFYKKIGYNYERFDDTGYENLVMNGEKEYLSNKEYYDKCLVDGIQLLAEWSHKSGKPLVTTECWAIVDYKDMPGLSWDWVIELNRLGVETAVSTACWAGMATSNFCGPQFKGMWSRIEWHKEMTGMIKK